MTKYVKFMKRLMSGRSDTDIAFDELCSLPQRLDFHMRVHGDHHIFTKYGIVEIINLQSVNSKPNRTRSNKSEICSERIDWMRT